MTLEDAKSEAIRRWGPEAIAVHNFKMSRNCEVASGVINPYIWATGDSWGEAFMWADVEQLRVFGHVRLYNKDT